MNDLLLGFMMGSAGNSSSGPTNDCRSCRWYDPTNLNNVHCRQCRYNPYNQDSPTIYEPFNPICYVLVVLGLIAIGTYMVIFCETILVAIPIACLIYVIACAQLSPKFRWLGWLTRLIDGGFFVYCTIKYFTKHCYLNIIIAVILAGILLSTLVVSAFKTGKELNQLPRQQDDDDEYDYIYS